MIDYLYDGTFEGFLTCVYFHYYNEKAAGIYPSDKYQSTLLQPCFLLKTDSVKAETVYKAIEDKISKDALRRIYYVFRSSVPDKENMAFQYICLGFKLGSSISFLHSNPIVLAVQQTARKVSLEAHRITGLLRFSVLCFKKDGEAHEILYANMKPDHDILEFLGDHFSDRFKNQPFIIHDIRRQKALYAYSGKWYVAPIEAENLPDPTKEEEEYRHLWKNYFKTIAIQERENPKCQKRMMPVRYWDCLTEMQ